MKTFLFFLSLCLLFFSSCEKPDDDETHHYRLWLANNTDMKILYDYRSTWYENNDQNTLKKRQSQLLQTISPFLQKKRNACGLSVVSERYRHGNLFLRIMEVT